ncbi:hypothetical protein [Corynebacterium pelargi]|uniref:Uncharacterized protein n=1 Tax=Corynebacterium pelargi TaxID=1471400 RepID=A0A410W8D0_9CORY|nr:hypothetical protein [Corynebacterium pelargi]QAU52220.1 hypothetical protein CPELA_04705 [Corynebacterium pelargi]GGG69267.1 hypothetical protein GCM10007338_02490 [Corynebacterium pelargi]
MTLTVSRNHGNLSGHNDHLGSRVTQPAQVWDIPAVDPRRARNSAAHIRTLTPVAHEGVRAQIARTDSLYTASPSIDGGSIQRAGLQPSRGKESAKKFFMGSLLGVVMVLSVLGAAQGEEDTAPKDAQQVVASLNGDSR